MGAVARDWVSATDIRTIAEGLASRNGCFALWSRSVSLRKPVLFIRRIGSLSHVLSQRRQVVADPEPLSAFNSKDDVQRFRTWSTLLLMTTSSRTRMTPSAPAEWFYGRDQAAYFRRRRIGDLTQLTIADSKQIGDRTVLQLFLVKCHRVSLEPDRDSQQQFTEAFQFSVIGDEASGQYRISGGGWLVGH